MRNALALGLAAAAFLVPLIAWAPDARANGRFPESNALFFAPNDPNHVILRTTFGQVVSHDRGKTWDWVCERSVGLAGVEDPMYSITPDNTVIASTFQGLAVSRDQSCSYAFVGGPLKELVFIDLASRPSTPENVVAFASSYGGQDDAGLIFFQSNLFETKDQGKTFTNLGAAFDPTLLGETVDVTASDPDRIYVSAVRDPGTAAKAVLLTSKNRGVSFQENPLALLPGERAAFIAAVDPVNADRLYVRTANAADQPSRLLVSDDAGKTFRTIFTGAGALAGFALSTDGTKVWVGGPKDGLRVASTSDYGFVKKSSVEIQCLKLGSDGLWACSNEKSGFVVGLSTDEGATFQKKLHFCDIRGPLACAAGTTTNTECSLGGTSPTRTPPWPPQRAVLGCSGETGADGGVHPDGAAGGDGSANPDAPPMQGGGGCSVRAPFESGGAGAPLAAGVVGIAATIALLRRRRSRR